MISILDKTNDGPQVGIKGKLELILFLSTLMSLGAIAWFLITLHPASWFISCIPLLYVVFSIANYRVNRTYLRNYSLFRAVTILSILLPCLMQILAGGVIASGAVMSWSMVALFGMSTTLKGQRLMKIVAFTFGTVLITLLLDPIGRMYFEGILTYNPNILLTINFIGAYASIFFLGKRFVSNSRLLHKSLKSDLSMRDSMLSELRAECSELSSIQRHNLSIQQSLKTHEDSLRLTFYKVFLIYHDPHSLMGTSIFTSSVLGCKTLISFNANARGSYGAQMAMWFKLCATRIVAEGTCYSPLDFAQRFQELIQAELSPRLDEAFSDFSLGILAYHTEEKEVVAMALGAEACVYRRSNDTMEIVGKSTAGLGRNTELDASMMQKIKLDGDEVIYLCSNMINFHSRENSAENDKPQKAGFLETMVPKLDKEFMVDQRNELKRAARKWSTENDENTDLIVVGFEAE